MTLLSLPRLEAGWKRARVRTAPSGLQRELSGTCQGGGVGRGPRGRRDGAWTWEESPVGDAAGEWWESDGGWPTPLLRLAGVDDEDEPAEPHIVRGID